MARLTKHSAFPFKKEMTIATAIWLAYAIPAAILFFHPKPQMTNICWAVVGGVTAFLVLPLLIRLAFMAPPADAVRVLPDEDITGDVQAL